MLFARVSILSVCVLAVAAAPARGQSTGGVPISDAHQNAASSSEAPAHEILGTVGVGTTKLFDANSLSKFLVGNNGDINIATGRIMKGCLCALNSVTTSAAATNTADGAGALQVTSRENIKIEIFGVVKLDAIYNRERPQAPGVPFFVVPKFAGGFTNHTFDINARQSLLGVLFTGPKIGNFQSGGEDIGGVFRPHRRGRP